MSEPKGAAPPGLRSEGRATREGGAVKGEWGGGRGPAGERENTAYGPVKRKEDARFIRGKGTFVDDIQLPGMLHGAILRSPLAHATVVSIDTTAAQAHPRVR